MTGLALLFRFMTRIPIGFNPEFDSEKLGKSMKFFPVIGIIIGIINYLFYILFSNLLMGPNIIVVVLLVLVELILTGGLHLDGLADTFDGIFSYRSKQKMLEIMKDSRLGTNGALVLMFYFILKIALLKEMDFSLGWILLITPVIARLNSVINCYVAPYARPTGMGKTFVDNTGFCGVVIATVITFGFVGGVLTFFGLPLEVLGIIPLTMICGYLYAKLMTRKIGGITGDTLGAILEISQILAIFFIYVMMVNF